jgi:hypothetical protein
MSAQGRSVTRDRDAAGRSLYGSARASTRSTAILPATATERFSSRRQQAVNIISEAQSSRSTKLGRGIGTSGGRARCVAQFPSTPLRRQPLPGVTGEGVRPLPRVYVPAIAVRRTVAVPASPGCGPADRRAPSRRMRWPSVPERRGSRYRHELSRPDAIACFPEQRTTVRLFGRSRPPEHHPRHDGCSRESCRARHESLMLPFRSPGFDAGSGLGAGIAAGR